MSKIYKAIERLKSRPKDFTYSELKKVLNYFKFYENNKGKTSGSRIEFYNKELDKKIEFHKPHNGNTLKQYQINSILEILNKMEGF